jgi:imidazolonepropionase-like amidohydrolase
MNGMRKKYGYPQKRYCLLWMILLRSASLWAQETFPINGVANATTGMYAFTGATIVQHTQSTLYNATMIIKEGKIVAIGTLLSIPAGTFVIDCRGKFIYPSFIDAYTDYGLVLPAKPPITGFDFFTGQWSSNKKGAYGWNQAIRSDVQAASLFVAEDSKAKPLRDIGFGTVLTHQKDGIARGTGAVVSLANNKENKLIIKDKASAHYAFNKGTSTQTYPNSIMGSIALIRQTYLDAQWYTSNPSAEGINLTLKSWNELQSLPQIFEATDKWACLRADRIGDEFGVQYILKAGGNEYQRIKEIAATKASFIVPLNFPLAMDVEDPAEARMVSVSDLKHWELAPTNPAAFEKNNITFCLTTADLKEPKQFMPNLRKAISYGLSANRALEALTKTPATLLGIYNKVGSLETGKLANFIITAAPLFDEKTVIFQNWIQGEKYVVNEAGFQPIAGTYQLKLSNNNAYTLAIKNNTTAYIIDKDTLTTTFNYDGKWLKLNFTATKKSTHYIRLSGSSIDSAFSGVGEDSTGMPISFTAHLIKTTTITADSSKKKEVLPLATITFPFTPYGWEELPLQKNILFKNATVWTNEAAGILQHTDVLVKNGKIVQVGKNIADATATTIDASGKHITPGIIDEHSHIATSSVNEGGQSVTAEVRITDNLNPDDINIYRQLSGGVTTAHILHGSANTIGGQTQLIKLRWGATDTALKFKPWTPFIKFALGENVKRTANTQGNIRFPDTRMGVEQVLTDAFQRATAYKNNQKQSAGKYRVRKDLELEALVEILDKKRFITCHSYVQSEIVSAMKVAEKFGFTFNTFTHILEGYKVADKIKAHGAAASTFSDWWMYKYEVVDAIPQNAALMQQLGINVAINSDDAEMARRLNQEAAKSIKYTGMSEIDALKMITLNPAIMLHVADKVGSIKVGKDADVVLWSDHPLSIYAQAEKTMVDGIIEFDRTTDSELRKKIAIEKNRLIEKMIVEKKRGTSVVPAQPSLQTELHCE